MERDEVLVMHDDSDIRKRSSSLDKAKRLVRKGSTHIQHLLDATKPAASELDLDLDAFYNSRMRRRTQFAQQISKTLLAAGITVDVNPGSAEKAASLSTKRGIGVTLSPGEEYENFQKVQATMMEEDGVCGPEDDMCDVLLDELEDEELSSNSLDKTLPYNQSRNHQVSPHDELRKAAMISSKKSSSLRKVAQLIDGKESSGRIPRVQMIDPFSRFRLCWDFTSIAFIFYNAIVLPFNAAFGVEDGSNPFEKILDLFFLIDIALTFNTAIEKDGAIRYDRRLVAKSYLKAWFIIDAIAALPYSYIFPKNGNYSTSLTKSIKLLRLVRLLRLLRISRIIRRVQNVIFIRSTLSSLMKYCLLVIFINHWFSCIFHAIALSNIEHSWIKAQGLDTLESTKWDRYVAALYVSVQTLSTIGFGDVAPQNANERLFSVFAMIVGGGIFAYGITNIVELVSSLTIQETLFRQNLDEVNEYMSARELPGKLRMEIREFYHNSRQSRESKLNSEQQILNDLSSKLRSKIALSINDQFLRKFSFFTGSEPNFLMELALNMRVIHFAPLENAIIEGEIGNEMFFIFRGAVEVVKKNVRIGILGENQYFGEMAILSPDNHRTATVRTLCFCELRMLSRARFLEALALFPAMQTKMAQIAQGRAAINNYKRDTEKQTISHSSSPAIESVNLKQESLAAPSPHFVPHGGITPTLKPVLESIPKFYPLTRKMSAARLPLEQRPSERVQPSNCPPPSIRMSNNVRRNSCNPAVAGVGSGMSIMIAEITSLLEEANRRQDLLVTQVLALKDELATMRPSQSDLSPKENTFTSI